MERPTQVTVPLTDYNKLMELVIWWAAIPECAQEIVGDRFFEYMHEEVSDLLGYDDETDTYCALLVEAREGKLVAVMSDAEGERFEVPVVAEGLEG